MKRAWMLVPIVAGLAACFDAVDRPLADVGADWRYDSQAPHFEHLPAELQDMTMHDPHALASAICHSMAGKLDFLGKPHSRDTRISFNCRMTEPGLAVSMDFGDLVRTQ